MSERLLFVFSSTGQEISQKCPKLTHNEYLIKFIQAEKIQVDICVLKLKVYVLKYFILFGSLKCIRDYNITCLVGRTLSLLSFVSSSESFYIIYKEWKFQSLWIIFICLFLFSNSRLTLLRLGFQDIWFRIILQKYYRSIYFHFQTDPKSLWNFFSLF